MSSGLLSFFEDGRYPPPDADTNSLASSVLLENGLIELQTANRVLNAVLSYRDLKGRVRVWLSDDMPGDLEALVGANALYFGYLLKREQDMVETENWIVEVLNSYHYIPDGTHYYPSPDAFLYFLGRLLAFPKMKERLHDRLANHLRQRIGTTEYSLDLAMRTILASSLGIPNEKEYQKILETQNADGSWPSDALFSEGRKAVLYGLYYGNKSLPTAFSIRALENRSKTPD